MRDYINETKIELVKRLTDIEIEIKILNHVVTKLSMKTPPSEMLESIEYQKLRKLRKDRNKLNETLDLMEALDV